MASSPKVALQLYTVRDRLAEDPIGALGLAAETGFQAIEWFGGAWGQESARLQRTLIDCGLSVCAAHISLEELRRAAEDGDLEQSLLLYRELGVERAVVPYLPPDQRSLLDYQNLGRELDLLSYRLKPLGFSLGYHNHEFEFELEGAHDGVELILNQSTQGRLFAEIDLFWVAWAGVDPARYLKEQSGRVELLHVKDGDLPRPKTASGRDGARFTALGDGDLPLAACIEAALRCPRLEALVIEIDDLDGDLEQCLRTSRAVLAEQIEATR